MKWRRTLIGLWFLAAVPQALAGGTVSVKLEVVKRDASYDVGEMASFRGSVLVDGKLKTRGVAVARLSDDGMATVSVQEFDLAKDNPFTVEGTLDEPGFLQCVVSYGRGSAIAAAAFAPAHIRPATTCPDDFATFWADALREIDQVPLDARVDPVPLFSSEHFACYKVSFATLGGSRIYGFLSVPRQGDGPFPAVVTVPGVGPGVFSPDIGCVNVPGRGMAARLRRDGGERAVSLVMNVHQYDPPRSWSALNERYNKLNASLPYYRQGVPDRDEYYYKKALLGVNRAVDWLASRPDVDPERIAAYGSRQGGAFALILAALNKHIKAVSASSPGLCDHAGHLLGRSPGWPRLVVGEGTATMRMAAYYDVVNFAPGIKCPVIASVGFVDTDCSPSSVYAAFNSVPTPKKMFNETKTANEMSFRFADYQRRWLRSQLGMDKDPLPPLASSR